MLNMQIESQVFLNCETHLHPKNTFIRDGDPGVVSQNHGAQQQQPAKKPTRQWAAWTRQEEESFFTALRQVGKNFEKITCRVQSKNKDQVRHYYYRLVRRMNKLLGPGLCLDAKNSKDTNAAMLRWWSLLEKYSCKASKLHLKPRRFKIFIETLENQLLKDRRKNVKKRVSQGENYSPMAPPTISNQSRPPGQDTRTVKLVLVDGQNIQKLGPVKGSLKRNVSTWANRSSSKGDLTAMKPARQRRKSGTVSSATYKKWETAAIAGVSLVADAAEHLERKDSDKEVEHDQGERGFDPVQKALPRLPTFSQSLFVGSNIHSSMKLKLQLFPIDDSTRRALEMDTHNPFLELTLSARKKISSVLEHLNRKWGNPSVASGEIMLFPYSVQRENLVGYHRWTQDSTANTADVYATIGSPPVFRLRYGWFSNFELGSVTSQATLASCCIPGEHIMNMNNGKNQIVDSVPISLPPTNEQSNEFVDSCKDQPTPVSKNYAFPPSSTAVPNEMNSRVIEGSKNNLVESCDLATNNLGRGRETVGQTITRQANDPDDMRLSNGTALSAGQWADSLTNVSVGDLLAEVPDDVEADGIETLDIRNSQCLQQIPFSCDSFDAAIAAHIYRHQDKMGFQPTLASHASSIWDAEETCDAFAFQKNCAHVPSLLGISSPEPCGKIVKTGSVSSCGLAEKLPVEEEPVDAADDDGDPINDCQSDTPALDSSAKDFSGLTDIYWPESLGPFDLDVPSSKYRSEDMILSDSLSGLNRLIASSLDAFQNCSFFGLDKKEHPASAVEVQENVSLLQ